MDPENVIWDKNGNRRGCKVCTRIRALARYYEMKERESDGSM